MFNSARQVVGLLRARFHFSSASTATAACREPVHLSLRPQEIVHNRYKIISHLGKGFESTVWLAEDLKSQKKEVAPKILTDYVTSIQDDLAFELRAMERISSLPLTSPGARHLPRLYDHFTITNDQAQHMCTVTEALGHSVLSLQIMPGGEGKAFPPNLVQHLTRQMLRALATLHDDCGVVHTDIKLDNMLFRRNTLNAKGVFDGSHALDPDNLVLIDYGTAIPLGVKIKRLYIQPSALRCPEALLGCPWGVKADIWNLGCIVFEMLTANRLFKPQPIGRFSAEQLHVARIYGSFVRDGDHDRLRAFFQQGVNYPEFFSDRGSLKLIVGEEQRQSLKQILEIYHVYTPELHEFLEATLQVHPDDRLTAKELQSLPWVQE